MSIWRQGQRQRVFFIVNVNGIKHLTLFKQRNITPLELEIILKHIRQHGNYIFFNVKALYVALIKVNHSNELVTIKQRDYNIITFQNYKQIDHVNALNSARMLVNSNVNYNNLFALIQERIINNDYEF
jgi:hypothetical protein